MPNDNNNAWMQAASSAAGSAIPAILGMIFSKSVDRRQIAQQHKLTDIQIEAEKNLMDYSMGKELQMWKDTGAVGQMEQLTKAGLNPGLIYGMNGAGGATTGSPTGNVSGGNAPVGGREIQDMIGMGMQMQMMKAQQKLIESQTNKTDVEAAKISGVDTTKTITEIQNLTQGIENQKATEQLTKAQNRMINLGNELADRTIEDRIEMVNYETKRACQEAQQAVNNTNVSDATIQDKIKIIKTEAISLLLRNSLTQAATRQTNAQTQLTQHQTIKTEAETKKIGTDTRVSEQTIRQISTGIEQNWDRINIDRNKIEIDRRLREEGLDLQDRGQILNAIQSIMMMGKSGTVITDQSYRPSEHYHGN